MVFVFILSFYQWFCSCKASHFSSHLVVKEILVCFSFVVSSPTHAHVSLTSGKKNYRGLTLLTSHRYRIPRNFSMKQILEYNSLARRQRRITVFISHKAKFLIKLTLQRLSHNSKSYKYNQFPSKTQKKKKTLPT